jgi:hypothetical protein
LIPIDYLYNIVQHNPVAKKLSDFNDHYVRGISYHALSDNMKKKLPSQPVKRKPIDAELFLAYTWMIPRDKLDNLVGTKQKHVSDAFWYCGYKMVLVIKNVVKVQYLGENQTMFTAMLCLAIFNLTQQSEVTIQWQPASQSFTSSSTKQLYTFEKKTPQKTNNICSVSSVGIKYIMKLQEETSEHGSAPTFSFRQFATPAKMVATTGFSFGIPSTSKPSFFSGDATPSMNTLATSKPGKLISKQESSIPCLSIDVKMKLI